MSTKKQTKKAAPSHAYRLSVLNRKGEALKHEFDTLILIGTSRGDETAHVEVHGAPEDVAELAESAKDSMVVIRRHAMEHMIASKRQVVSTGKAKPNPRRKLAVKKVAPKAEKK